MSPSERSSSVGATKVSRSTPSTSDTHRSNVFVIPDATTPNVSSSEWQSLLRARPCHRTRLALREAELEASLRPFPIVRAPQWQRNSLACVWWCGWLSLIRDTHRDSDAGSCYEQPEALGTAPCVSSAPQPCVSWQDKDWNLP